MKKRFTEQQIIGFLKEAEAGMPVKELCRKHGFSDASPHCPATPPPAEIDCNQGHFDFRRAPVASSVYVPVFRPSPGTTDARRSITTLHPGDLR
ncbi:transposase [Burkholderia sp. JKS000303]|nr:transposase [Burkholderia sp. JKS000303]